MKIRFRYTKSESDYAMLSHYDDDTRNFLHYATLQKEHETFSPIQPTTTKLQFISKVVLVKKILQYKKCFLYTQRIEQKKSFLENESDITHFYHPLLHPYIHIYIYRWACAI